MIWKCTHPCYIIFCIFSKKVWAKEFRNAMAHYKLGVALKKEELVSNDLMYGLTIK